MFRWERFSMAKFEHLKIYKSAYDLLIVLHRLHPSFPKAYKYSLGQSLLDTMEKAILEIAHINSSHSKHFTKLLLLLEQVKLKIRMLKTLSVISQKTYCVLLEESVNLLRQAQGWQSYSQRVSHQSREATVT
jgi:hypothetical protein